MSHKGSLELKRFNLSCPDNDTGNAFVHCNFRLLSGGEVKLPSLNVFYLITGLDMSF